jgi:uncharacterized hydrophobic protein (TIGR00271 family)
MKDNLVEFIKDAFSIKYDTITNREIKKVIIAGTKVKGTNLLVLLISIVIACVGLNINSIPIVIGAMLISPLMTGVMAIGYSYATRDSKLLSNAIISLLVEVVLCIITSTVYFSISPIHGSTPELLSRISPTFYDVLIAVFGGLAGIIGLTRKDSDKGNVVPGVAIATALIPPLCTAGYGLATLQFNYFFGALYLFIINLFFIMITTYIFTKVMNLPIVDNIEDPKDQAFSMVFMIAAIIIIVLPTVLFTYNIIQESFINNEINSYIKNEFNFNETQVINSKIDISDKLIEVVVVGKNLSKEDIDLLNERKNQYLGLSNFTLKLFQNELIDSVTKEELNDILVKYSSDVQFLLNENIETNDIELELKVNKIEELEIKISELEMKINSFEDQINIISSTQDFEINIVELRSELININDTITDIRIEDKFLIDENDNIINSINIILEVNNLLIDQDLKTIKLLIAEKLSNSKIEIVQLIK